MTETKTAAVILAAGLGTRMKSATPKVLHPLAGRPMILHLLATLKKAKLAPRVVVVGKGMQAVADAVRPHPTVVQHPALGTGHAVMQALPACDDEERVLVLYADVPVISIDTLKQLLKELKEKREE